MNRTLRFLSMIGMSKLITTTLTVLALTMAVPAAGSEILVDEPEAVEGTEDCVWTRTLRRTEVLDDRNILFFMTGGKIYRNFLPRRCHSLSNRRAFSYETRVSQLCRSDRITVLDTLGFGGVPGPSCALGKFYPVTENEVEAMREQIETAKEAGITGPDPQ